jgi:hypothetical protein
VDAIAEIAALARRQAEPTTRWLAAAALGELGEAAELRRLLGDADPAVRWSAAQGLGRLGEPGDFAAMLGDKDALARFWSGLALARRGQADGVAPALERRRRSGAPISSGSTGFARRKGGSGWGDDARRGAGGDDGGTPEIRAQGGLKLEIDAPLIATCSGRIPIPDGRVSRGRSTGSGLTCSEFLVDSQPSRVRYEILLEPDRLRSSLKAGLEF